MITAVLMTLFANVAPAQAAPPAKAPAIRLELHREPFLDLWFQVRALGEAKEGGETPALLAEAVAAARTLNAGLESPLLYGPLEGLLASCHDAKEALAVIDRVPESVPKRLDHRPGGRAELRAPARVVLEALAKVETEWRAKAWPKREEQIASAQRELEQLLVPKQAALWEQHARQLGFEGLDLAVPCFLVAEAPWPGAVTHRGEGGHGVSFVSVEEMKGLKLCEVVVHEATHALDVARDDDVFDELRAALEKAGFGPRERAWRDVPHALMFVASADTVRAVLDPKHHDYGETDGVYERIGASAAAVRGAWGAYAEGKSSRAEFVAHIVAALGPPAGPGTAK